MRIVSMAGAVAAVLLTPPAQAQQVGDLVDLRRMEVFDPQQAQVSGKRQAALALASFADCIVSTAGGEADAREYIVRTGWKSGRDGRVNDSRFTNEACMSENTRLDLEEPLLSRALASALYKKNFGDSDAPAMLTPSTTISEEFTAEGDAQTDAIAMRHYGDCVVAGLPAQSHAFVLTEVASREERKARRPLEAVLKECIDADRDLKFSLPVLRGILAEALLKGRERAQ